MHQNEIEYMGILRARDVHLQSDQNIISDTSTDNKGKGKDFIQLILSPVLWEAVL